MTKFLKVALDQHHPNFHQSILKINKISGKTNNDIYFTETMRRLIRDKLKMLGLDPHDTTSEELYFALREKIKQDENSLTRRLRYLAADKISAEANLLDGLILRLNQSCQGLSMLALRSGFLKTQLSNLPLKKTVKFMGYRTKASMFKREPMSLIFSMAQSQESASTAELIGNSLRHIGINNLSYTPIIFKKENRTRIADSSFADFKSATIYLSDKTISGSASLIKFLIEIGEIINTWVLKDRILDFVKFRDDFSVFYNFMLNDKSVLPNEFLEKFIDKFSDFTMFSDILEDLNIVEKKTSLSRLDNKILHLNNLDFWSDTNYLLNVNHHQSVSFNVKDIVSDIVEGVDFAYRSLANAQLSLKKELINQYFNISSVVEYLSGVSRVRTDNLLKEVFVGQ